MKDNQFDEVVKNKLEKHESMVPDFMWRRIAEKGKDDKVVFGFRWYFITIGLLMVGFLGTYFFINHYKNKAGIATAKPTLHAEKEKIKQQNILEQMDANNKIIQRQKDVVALEEGNLRTEKLQVNEKKTNAKTEIHQVFPRISKVVDKAGYVNDNSTMIPNAKSLSATGDKVQESVADSMIAAKVAATDALESTSEKIPDPDVDKFALEMYASPDLSIYSISASNKQYEQVLKDAVAGRFSYTVGARLEYKINSQWSAKIGVQLSQVNERVSFYDSVNSAISTTSNKYKHIGIPLLISYRTNLFKQLKVSITSGVIFNISSKYKGVVPSVSGVPIYLEHEKVFDENAKPVLYFGLGVSKLISSRIDVFAEPWLNYRLSNMANRYYSFNQKIHSAGLAFGISYRLYRSL